MKRLGNRTFQMTYQEQATLLAAVQLYKLMLGQSSGAIRAALTQSERATLKNTATNAGEFPDMTLDEIHADIFPALEAGLSGE